MDPNQAQQILNDMNAGKIVWDDNLRAQADNALRGGGGGSDPYSSLINAITSMIGSPPEPYETKNPFSFDEELARQASTAEYAPYYDEMLADYTSEIERTKTRSTDDLKRTLEFLAGSKEYFVGSARRVLDKAIDSTSKGYAGQNLFFSGARDKDIRELKEEDTITTNEYLRGYDYQKSGAELSNQRTLEDAELKQKIYNRDIERDKQYTIESGILQRKTEAREEYEAGRNKYYQNYPSYYGGLT